MKKQAIVLLCVMSLSLFTGVFVFAENMPSTSVTVSADSYEIKLNNKSINFQGAEPYEKNGHIMIPIRTVGQELGFTVTWDESQKCAKIANDDFYINVCIGIDSYSTTSNKALGMATPQSVGIAPEMKDGSTYVSSEMIRLLGYEVVVQDKIVSIKTTKETEQTKLSNPMKEYNSIEDVKVAADFDVLIPEKLPEGYNIASIYFIAGQVVEINYSKDNFEICYRTAQSKEDISGNYNVYPENKTLTISGLEVTVKGNDGAIFQAFWTKDDLSYSIGFSQPVDTETLDSIISSIQ